MPKVGVEFCLSHMFSSFGVKIVLATLSLFIYTNNNTSIHQEYYP